MTAIMPPAVVLTELIYDALGEGWIPHPFVQHLSEKCAVCGSTADRAVHDRKFALGQHITWERVLTVVDSGSEAQG